MNALDASRSVRAGLLLTALLAVAATVLAGAMRSRS